MSIVGKYVSKDDMKNVADSFESFLEFREEVAYISKEMNKNAVKEYNQSVEIVKELIRKLNKGKQGVFKDPDNWDHLI